MAKFMGHVYGAAALSSAAAIAVHGLGWTTVQETQALFFLGVAGGLLPDIDADNSKPVRGFFSLLGVTLAFLVSLSLVGHFPVVELALIWAGVFLLVRYGVFEAFARFTVHRGIWHSWLAVAFAGLASVDAAFHFAGFSAFDSWLCGCFVALGYLTHLCLDELASVDLLGNRVRRSFGTALKPFSIASPWASLAMLAGVLILAIPAPTVEPLVAAVRSEEISVEPLAVRLPDGLGWMARLQALPESGH